MTDALKTDLLTPEEAVSRATTATAANGVRYATLGRLDTPNTTPAEIARMVGAVPAPLAGVLNKHVYVFVPLALSAARLEGDESTPFSITDRTLIAPEFHASLVDKAICHRNAPVADTEYVFLSSRLHIDRFALAFEFFINVAHNFVDSVGVPVVFGEMVWKQALANVRGETSIDAWEERAEAMGHPLPAIGSAVAATIPSSTGVIDEKARGAFYAAAFADALAVYLLSLHLDFDYADLREREYPLLAAPALAERLRMVNKLFPANDGYQFQILYRRRG